MSQMLQQENFLDLDRDLIEEQDQQSQVIAHDESDDKDELNYVKETLQTQVINENISSSSDDEVEHPESEEGAPSDSGPIESGSIFEQDYYDDDDCQDGNIRQTPEQVMDYCDPEPEERAHNQDQRIIKNDDNRIDINMMPRKGKSLHVLAIQQSRGANGSSSGVITGYGGGAIHGESSSVMRSNFADSDLILQVGKSAQKYLNVSKR